MLSQNFRNELPTYTVFISPEREAVSGYDSVTKYVRRNYITLRYLLDSLEIRNAFMLSRVRILYGSSV